MQVLATESPETDKYPVSVGFGVFTIGGMADNYASPRLNLLSGTGTADYDKMVDLRVVRFAPGIAVAFNDKLSFGLTANIDVEELRTD